MSTPHVPSDSLGNMRDATADICLSFLGSCGEWGAMTPRGAVGVATSQSNGSVPYSEKMRCGRRFLVCRLAGNGPVFLFRLNC
jgi:hypothetical protein